MDVKLPDGTIVKNVPDNITQAELITKLESSGHDVTALKKQYAQSIIKDAKERGFGTGIPKVAYEAGGAVTDMTGSPAAGFATNVLLQAIPSFLTSASKVGEAPLSLLEWPARKLMQNSVKPSSTLPPKKVNEALGTMLSEGIYPTQSGMQKASAIAGKLDDQVDAALAGSNANVGVAAIGSRLREPFEQAKTQVNPAADMAAVRKAWDDFVNSPLIKGKTEIPAQLAHEIKKGTYASIAKKSFNEVGTASTEAQKALARGAREEVAKAVPEVVDPLARQAAMMNVKEVAGTRALIEANKNPLGLAALRMDNPLSAATFMADRWAALKAFLALQMFHGAKPQTIAPLAEAMGMAQSQPTPNLGALYIP